MLKVGFIFPSSDYLHDPFRGDPHTHFQILTVLDDRCAGKVDASLIDLRGINRKFADYHIPECDVYLHSTYTLDFEEQCDIVKKTREHYPKSIHMAGGPHANVFVEDSLKVFDSVILGEGEESIVEAMNDIENLSLKKIYNQKSRIDINKYPFPSRRYLPKSTIARKNMMNLRRKPEYDSMLGTTTIFSRGCPYNCHFCAMPLMRGDNVGIRYRKPESIENEINYLRKDFGISCINLLDEIGVPLDNKRATSYLEAIARTGIYWRGQCRVDGVNEKIAKLMKQSGCLAMGMGIESASQRCLDIINKKINLEEAKNAIRTLKANDIEARMYLIMGLPGEPEDIVERSWNFIEETKPDIVYLSLFTVRPGTEVFNNPEKFGIAKIDTDWKKTRHMFGRYEHEEPTITFEYSENTPFGKGFTRERIVRNYVELQSKLREIGLSH